MIKNDGGRAIPIKINSKKKSSSRQIAASAPTLTYVPPAAPTSRPSIPSRDPPPIMLPPSPPVFSPIEINSAKKQAESMQRILSTSFTMSSSCPANMFDPSLYAARNVDNDVDDADDGETEDFDALGKSPTIFSLLSTSVGGTVPNEDFLRSRGFTEGVSSGLSSKERESFELRGSTEVRSYEDDQTNNDDNLLFSISIDEHEDNYLGDDVRDSLQSLFL